MTSLDPDVAALLPALDKLAARLNGTEVSAGDLRSQFTDVIAHLRQGEPEEFDGTIGDAEVTHDAGPPVPVRIYEPAQATDDVVVLFHGGGWVVGDCDSADGTARALGSQVKSKVVSVHYRLAPEQPFPHGLDDCLAVTGWAASAYQPAWLAVAGDSAGGNLAAAVSLAAPTRGLSIDAQLLLYPALDSSMAGESHRTFAEGYGLTASAMRYYWDSYAADEARTNPLMSPSHATDLSGQPPTVITNAGYDPLHDEAEQYAARLIASDVTTMYLPAPSLAHGWLDMSNRVLAARRARDEAFAALDFLKRNVRRSAAPAR